MPRTRYTSDLLGLRESTLHRDLKSYYAYLHDGFIEQTICGYRIDVLAGKRIYEIQTKAFYKLRPKIRALVDEGYSVRVIYPLQGVIERRSPTGGTRRRRVKAQPIRAFQELVYLAKMLPTDGLEVEVLSLHERATMSKARRNRVRNTHLVAILRSWLIQTPPELLKLLPGPLPSPFTTKDIVNEFGVGKVLASRIAYTLHHSGVSTRTGRRNRYALYELVDDASPQTQSDLDS
jgi:hypothetical protein